MSAQVFMHDVKGIELYPIEKGEVKELPAYFHRKIKIIFDPPETNYIEYDLFTDKEENFIINEM